MSDAQSGSNGSSKANKPSHRGARPRLFLKDRCQAEGCPRSLKELAYYNRRNHICMEHKTAESFHRLGELVRFCQRCGVAHPLADFDGTKRSCRKKLEKHNARRRKPASASANSNSAEVNSSKLSEEILSTDFSAPIPLLPLPGSLVVNNNEDLFSPLLFDDLPPPPILEEQQPSSPSAGVFSSPSVAALSTSGNERVCCDSGDECICCCSDDNEPQKQQCSISASANALPASSDAVSSSPGYPVSCAAPNQAEQQSVELEQQQPNSGEQQQQCSQRAASAFGNDTNACSSVEETEAAEMEEEQLHAATPAANTAAEMAAAEAELAALRVTDAALYAVVIHQQLLQASRLVATAGMLHRSRSNRSMSLERRESSGDLSQMMVVS